MTSEEAIEILQGAIKKPNTKDGYLGQAIDMAIQALSQEPCADAVSREDAYGCLTFNGHYDTLNEVYERLKHLPSVNAIQHTSNASKDVEQRTNTLGDAISRQAVLSKKIYTETEEGWSGYTVDADYIENLPSVTPEPKWIPVSERLPTGQTEVIASIHDDSGDNPFDYTASGWITDDGEYWIVDGEINYYVIAWMPLPKPFEPQESEGKE